MTMKKIKLFDYQEDMVKRVQEAFNFLHVSYGIFRKLSYLYPRFDAFFAYFQV